MRKITTYLLTILIIAFSSNTVAQSISDAWANCLAYAVAYGPSQSGCKPAIYPVNTPTQGSFITNPGGYSPGTSIYDTGCAASSTWVQPTPLIASCQTACIAGQTATLQEGREIGNLMIYIGGGPTLTKSGCSYTCGASSSNVVSDGTKNYSTYSCTSTGQPGPTTGPTVATNYTTSAPSASTTDSNGSTCVKATTGQNICVGGNLPAGCFTTDGVKACDVATPNKAKIEETTVASTDSKNCVQSGSKTLCVVAPADTGKKYCGLVNGVQTCYNPEGVKTTTAQTTAPGPGGVGTIVTTTTTNNIYGGSPTVTTTAYGADGKQTGQTTSGGTAPSDSLLGSIADSLKALKDGQGKQSQCDPSTGQVCGSGTASGPSGPAADYYTPTTKTLQSITEAGIDGIKNEPVFTFGKEIFNVTFPAGTCPVWNVPDVMGMGTYSVDALCAPFMEDVWLLVSSVIKFLSTLIAFRIALSVN